MDNQGWKKKHKKLKVEKPTFFLRLNRCEISLSIKHLEKEE